MADLGALVKEAWLYPREVECWINGCGEKRTPTFVKEEPWRKVLQFSMKAKEELQRLTVEIIMDDELLGTDDVNMHVLPQQEFKYNYVLRKDWT